jgi:predicted DNA-binding transcriptional regulator YafY
MAMKNPPSDKDTVATLLGVVADLLRGTRYSRRTLAKTTGKSLPTADRWIEQIAENLPTAKRVREGKTTWLVHEEQRRAPSRPAAVGACIAASLGSIFDGSEHERNLKDARDYMLRERGDVYADLDRKFVLAPRGGEYALPEAAPALDAIVEALLNNKRIRFSYKGNDGRVETPVIEPLSLIIFEHQFYVLVRRTDGTFYPYRFARMKDVDATGETFVYPSKSEFDPKSVLSLGFGIHTSGTGPVEEVEVILSGPWASYAMTHRWHPTQQVAKLDDGAVRVTLRVRTCRELETWVLGFGEHARVIKPDKLRTEVAGRLVKASAVYEQPPPARPSIAKADRQHADRTRRKRAR